MSNPRRTLKTLLLATTAVAGFALLTSGCCHRRAHAWAHKGHKGHMGHGFSGKGMHGGCGAACKGKKGMKLGAPKLLCPKKLIMKAKWMGISDEQVTKLKAIKKAHRAKQGELRLAMKRAKLALKVEWMKDAPDAAKIRELANALAAVKQAKIAAKAEHLIQTKDVLTPEQYKKILMAPCKGCGKGKAWGGKGCKGCKGCPGCKGMGPRGMGPHGMGPHGPGPHGPGMGHGPHGKPPCANCVK